MIDLSTNIDTNTLLKSRVDNLKKSAENSVNDDETLMKTCRDFESILVQRMFNEMAKTTDLEKSFGKGSGGEFFKDMFFQNVSDQIAQRSEGGLAETMYRQLKGEAYKKDKDVNIRELNSTDITHRMSTNPLKIDINPADRFNKIIEEMADKYGVDSNMVRSVIKHESGGDYRAVSKAGAKGLMQLMDGTASDMGISNPFDPKQNIEAGTKYLSKMLDKFDNDLSKALAAYNAGPGNVDKYNGIPPFKETQDYVQKVISTYNDLKK